VTVVKVCMGPVWSVDQYFGIEKTNHFG
jgi:hypothetical protein